MFRKKDTHIHFVGVGGIGMSGLAEILLDLEYRVTGTDLVESETTKRLRQRGATIGIGHARDHLGDADVVVVSSAVSPHNPELLEARERHIPVIPRAEMLAELMRLKHGIAIAGSHGKTTTTSLVASILHEAGLDPTIVIGGKVNSFGSNARMGRSDLLVAEADESDGSFLLLSPTWGVVTNIDAEHLDHYGSLAAIQDAFLGFLNRVPFYGRSVVCLDDPHVRALLPRVTKRVVTYGLCEGAEYRATNIQHDGLRTTFRVSVHGQDRGLHELHLVGIHNVANALAALAIADIQEIPAEISRAALASFEGVDRRFSVRAHLHDILVVDDYGHHPTEIQATLEGARTAFNSRRIIAVLQPHRYTRLRDHLEAFARCLDAADRVVLLPVYAAGEAPIAGIDATSLFERITARRPERPTRLATDLDHLHLELAAELRPGDLLVTLGAGSVTRVGPRVAEAIARAREGSV